MSEKLALEEQSQSRDAEKGDVLVPTITSDICSSSLEIGTVRLDPFGSALSPTPTADSMDPLNWSKFQKYICIAVVCYAYFLFTYLCTAPIPSFTQLQDQFDATYTQINWSYAIPSLGLALGPLFCSGLANIYGRRIVMIAGTTIALVASGCTSVEGISLHGYMTARFFQGFGASPAATVGLSIINDVSWEHERGFRIGLWVMAIDLGGLLGGLIGAFITTTSQYWVAYHVAILFAVLLLAECLFLPETLFPRNLVVAREERIRQCRLNDSTYTEILEMKRTKQLGYLSFRKIPGVIHPKPWDTAIRAAKVFAYPTVVLSVLAFTFLQYWWLNSLLTMLPAAYATYSIHVQGLFFIGLILGTVFAEVFFSGRLSDLLMVRLAKQNNGIRKPEYRLWLGHPGAILSGLGLLIWGLSIDRSWHWITGQIAFFLFAAGLQIGNTALSSYIVDSYYEHSMDVIVFYSVLINLAAFAEPWFINIWVEASGYTWSFAAQAIICTFGVVSVYIVLQIFGPRWRKPMSLGKEDIQDSSSESI